MKDGDVLRISAPMDTIERRHPITLHVEATDGQPRIFLTGNTNFLNLIWTESAAKWDRRMGFPPDSEQPARSSLIGRFLGKIGLA